MLELNRNVEVAIHGQAADMEWTLVRDRQDKWIMEIEGVSDVSLAAGGTGSPTSQPIPRVKRTFELTDAQAAATLALFIGDDVMDDEVNAELYRLAEQVWNGVPMHFRPIP